MFFLEKHSSNYGSYSGHDFSFQKPGICPHCGITMDADFVVYHCVKNSYDESYLYIYIWKCTSCKKLFISFYDYKTKGSSIYLGMFPERTQVYSNESVAKVSPRFVSVYNEALTAEAHNSLQLAAIGFRTALEILIKDYAVNCLKEDKETVAKLSLANAIDKYLSDTVPLFNSADVVRILGNDSVHYASKHPDIDFPTLKNYMDIFVRLLEMAILPYFPPVHRQT